MPRDLRLYGSGYSVSHGSRHDAEPEGLYLSIMSADLKATPLHRVDLTEDEALRLIASLSEGIVRGRRLAAEREARRAP